MPIEVLTVHIGQCGIQLSAAFWELLCLEHGITPDGELIDKNGGESNEKLNCFFQLCNNGHYIPRTVLVDGEYSVLQEVRSGCYRNLFPSNSMISSNEDSAGNFARGSFLCGSRTIRPFKNYVRRLHETTDYGVDGILFICSNGGGTGSGMSALFMQQITNDFPKIKKFQFCNMPSPVMNMSVVEPYNTIFNSQTTIDTSDFSMMFDNEALANICGNLLLLKSPNLSDFNRIMSLMLSSVTASVRFHNTLYSGLQELRTNLVPYPRIHYTLMKFAPLSTTMKLNYENNSIDNLTKTIFTIDSKSAKCDINKGKAIAISLTYRGSVSAVEINLALQKYRDKNIFKFVDWVPTGFKLAIIQEQPMVAPECFVSQMERSAAMVINTTAIKQIWGNLNRKFDVLYEKRSFVHWFLNEGLESSEFDECRTGSQNLYEDYKEIEMTEEELYNEYKEEQEQGEEGKEQVEAVQGGELSNDQ